MPTSGSSKITAINPAGPTITGNYQTSIEIIDLAICIQSGNVAISLSNNSSGNILILNAFDLEYVDSYSLSSSPGKLQYIDEVNRLYCITSSSINTCLYAFSINGDNITYLPNYSLNDFSIKRGVSSCYNSNHNFGYFVGPTALENYKLVIIDYERENNEDPIISEIENPFLCQAICPSNDRVYLAGYSLLELNGAQIENSVDLHGEVCHLIQAGQDLAITDREGDAICTYSNDLELLQNISTGDFIIKGCSNYTRQKLYWINRSALNPQSGILIQDLSNDSFSSIEIGPRIDEIAYHENADKIVVSNLTYQMQSQLTILDGLENQILHQTALDWILHVFPGKNNFTYVGGGNVLKFL
jgi:hypothetical protein